MLTPIQKLALSNVALSKKERATIEQGDHNVSFTVKIDGVVKVAGVETYTPTADVPLIPTVALALKRMGIQRENFLKVMKDAMTEVLTSDENMRDALVKESGLNECEAMFRATLATLPRKSRLGKTKASLEAKLIKNQD